MLLSDQGRCLSTSVTVVCLFSSHQYCAVRFLFFPEMPGGWFAASPTRVRALETSSSSSSARGEIVDYSSGVIG